MTKETFAPMSDVFDSLESIPGVKETLPIQLAAMEQMNREHRVGLATIRQVAAMTQNEVAQKLGVQQAAVSKIENRGDVLLSTLKSYFDAVGAIATITVKVGNVEHHATLDELISA